MLFLMNDAVLNLDLERLTPPVQAGRFSALPLPALMRLGAEMFAERPLLQRDDPARAERLGALIVGRAPGVNAALFTAPHANCRPDEVASSLAEVALEVMAELYAQALGPGLTPALADRRVWRRMAA